MSRRILLFVSTALFAAQCGGDNTPTRPVNGVIEIMAAEFEFRPSRIALDLGKQAVIQVTSEDESYTFTIDELKIDEIVPAGEMVEVNLRANQEGEFTYYSALEGHREKGMVGKLSVARRPVATGATTSSGGVSGY
jgi:heme/copper-type cytochrome/quinol oxidase subunit 2